MAGKQTIAVIIFLFILIVLAGFVAIRATLIYKGTTAYVNQTTTPLMECTGYIYSVSEIGYSDAQLTFLLENKVYSDKKIGRIVVAAGNVTKEVVADLIEGTKKRIIVGDLEIGDKFFVFPKGCEFYAKEYSIIE